jgi:YVTN family beta-propeller protein
MVPELLTCVNRRDKIPDSQPSKVNQRKKLTMTKRMFSSFCGASLLLLLSACNPPETPKSETPAAPPPRPAGAYHVYVTNERSGNLTIIDSVTNEVVSTVALGKRPRGIHVSPDKKTIYVALSGSPIAGPGVDESKLPPADKKADGIGVFDIASGKLTKVIHGGSDPEEFDLSLDGKLLYTSNEDTAEASIIDIAKGELVAAVKVGEEPEGVQTTPDGKFVYVTSENDGAIFVIDTATQKLLKSFKVGLRPRSVAFFPELMKAYVTRENDGMLTIIDMAKHAKTGEIKIGDPRADPPIKPMKVISTADGKTAYVSAGRGKKVFTIDTATDKVTGDFEVGTRPWGIALSPDGKLLYTANGSSNDVSVVDVATKMVIKKIKAGESPWGVLVVTD